jgi:Phosphoenolpyruvate carboxylase
MNLIFLLLSKTETKEHPKRAVIVSHHYIIIIMTATYLLLLLLSVAHASPSFWDPQAIRRAVIPHGGGGSSSAPSTVAADEASTEEVLVADIPHGGSTATATSSARLLAKNQEETQSMSVSLPLGSSQLDNERDAPLMRDLELLSGILSNIVNTKEDAKVHDLYEEFRHYALIRANNDPIQGTEALQNMIQLAKELEPTQALGVVRTFSIMLNLVNAAEVHHRDRRMRQYQHDTEQNEQQSGEGGGAAAFGGPLPNVEDSMRGTMLALLKSNLATEQEIYQQLVTQKVEIVLTAHPTEVQRKSLLRKYRKITEALAQLDGPESGGAVSSSSNKSYYSTSYAQQAARQELEMTISSIWGADEIRRSKPTPQQEAAGGNAILESVLWDAVPAYLRKLDQQCQLTLHKRLPVDCSPIHFASWIGGDRDGVSVHMLL